MHKIRFRGKAVDTGKWVYGDLLQANTESVQKMAFIFNDIGFNQRIIIATIGQYIGLQDINNIEMYEGDIVKYNKYTRFVTEEPIESGECQLSGKGIIRFKDGEFYPRPVRYDIDDYWYSWGMSNFEIIGNIYDNPEIVV
jgi:uncharacterized phage protein (TIGR01671 family)